MENDITITWVYTTTWDDNFSKKLKINYIIK